MEGPIRTDRDQCIEAVLVEGLEEFVRAVAEDDGAIELLLRPLEGVTPIRRAEDRPPEVRNTPDRLAVLLDERLAIEVPAISLPASIDLPRLMPRREDRRLDHGMQAGGIAPPCMTCY